MAFIIMSDAFEISRAVFEQMLTNLQAVYPEEGCGLLSGKMGSGVRHYRIENILHSPTRYEMNPKEQIEAFIDAESRGGEITAVYHSHPHGPQTPSETDIQEATYPDLVYLIVSFQDFTQPSLRGFKILNNTAYEVALTIL